MFVDDILNTISIDPSSATITIFDKITITPYTSISDFIAFLAVLDLKWEFLQKQTYKQQAVLQLASGVQLSFKYQETHGLLFSKAQAYNK